MHWILDEVKYVFNILTWVLWSLSLMKIPSHSCKTGPLLLNVVVKQHIINNNSRDFKGTPKEEVFLLSSKRVLSNYCIVPRDQDLTVSDIYLPPELNNYLNACVKTSCFQALLRKNATLLVLTKCKNTLQTIPYFELVLSVYFVPPPN